MKLGLFIVLLPFYQKESGRNSPAEFFIQTILEGASNSLSESTVPGPPEDVIVKTTANAATLWYHYEENPVRMKTFPFPGGSLQRIKPSSFEGTRSPMGLPVQPERLSSMGLIPHPLPSPD